MATDSSRTARIDQFFASKKRKSPAPGVKSKRNEKIAKVAAEESPSSKGGLDNFVVTSPDDTAKHGDIANRLVDRQSTVTKSLLLSTEFSSGNVDKQSISSMRGCSQTVKGSESKMETSQGSFVEGDVVKGDHGKGIFVYANPAENSELKQFATDFLSLYCREVPSSVGSRSEPARLEHGHPPLSALEVNISPRSLYATADDCSQSQGETTCPPVKNVEERHSAVKTGEKVLSSSAVVKVKVCGDSTLLPSLAKCTNTSESIVQTNECYTPGQLSASKNPRETPKSLCGSSIFSPGESFWNEAIQLADGLYAPNDQPSIHADEETDISMSQHNIKKPYKRKYGMSGEKAKEVSGECGSRYKHINNGFILDSQGKIVKDSGKNVSPLPVKRFDFTIEDRNLDGPSPAHFHEKKSAGLAHGRGKLSHYGSVNPGDPQTSNPEARCGNSQTNDKLHQTQLATVINVDAKNKEDSLIQDNDNVSITPRVPQGFCKRLSTFENSEAITPSSFLPLKDSLDLSIWLPSEICSIYRKKGISKLYAWQLECLQVDGVLLKRNLVYCASTSAGKSFVAEILMLRRVISTGKMALLVLPYVSICTEKAEHLEVILEPLGKHVRSYYGNQGGGTLPKDTSVAVCTIEKANSLINRLLEEGRLSELGIIVIDELHMVGDQHRGYLLELLLTKLRYAAGEGNVESLSGESSGSDSGKRDPSRGLQIVGMSATMPNVGAVADWLQAALYQTDFRPVPLEEYIKVGSTIYDKNMNIVRTISKASDLGGKDPDHIVELCNEVVQEGHSVLIFCSSRKGCESTARHISKFLTRFQANTHTDDHEFMNVTSAIDALRRSPAGLDPVLEETLPFGVAYHHAGLTAEEREVVETCYRRGLVRVLTATSTLAAGVNLPARRVIFRQPRIGRDFLDGTRYKQMAGRAGRTGIDTKGESVLLCKPEEIKRILGLLNDSCPPLHSCLSEDKNGMTHAILEVVAGGIVQTADDIHRYVRCTLLNSTKPFQDVVKSAQDSLRWLCHMKFLEWNDDSKLYSSTPLGRAAFGSSLCPEESLVVLDDLSRAREGFVLASDLHLVYLVTPINVDVEPDWELFYERFMQLPVLDQSVGNRVGVLEPFLMRKAHGAPVRSLNRAKDNQKGPHVKIDNKVGTRNLLSDEQTLRVCKRFYVALILSRLVQEAPVAEVCEAFKVARGMVQALQENAGRFASMVSMFCERLGWHDLEGLVAKFQNRVSFGVRAEIVELTTIPYVKGSRARALYKDGLRTPQAIAEASISQIAKALFESSSWTAQENPAQRRLQLGVAKKIKNGARKIVFDKAEESRVAAFTAFKSLGLDVPQFSRPIVSTYTGNLIKESGTTSSGEDNVGSFLDNNHMESVSAKPPERIMDRSNENEIATQGGSFQKISDNGLTASARAHSTNTLQCNFGAENSTVPVCRTEVEGDEPDAPICNPENAGVSLSTQLKSTVNVSRIHGSSSEHRQPEHPNIEKICFDTKDIPHEKGPANATCIPGGLDSFLDLWDTVPEFYFDVHFNKQTGLGSAALFEVHGMAICWDSSPVYYLNIPKDLLSLDNVACDKKILPTSVDRLETAKHRWNRISKILEKQEVRKFTWHLKVQIQVLKSPAVSIQRFGSLSSAMKNMGSEVLESSYFMYSPVCIQNGIDLSIVAWILWPDEERSSNPNLEKEAKKRLSTEAFASAGRCGRWKNQMRRAAHNGCCRRVALTRALSSVFWKLLISEELVEVLTRIETPLVNVLANMESCGIGVDMDGCLRARHVLGKKLKHLEKEAYRLAGMTFSLYMAADVAKVLYEHLKLTIPEGHKKGKQHPSTDKHSLDFLRHEHPLVPIIKEHRTLSKLLNCTLGSICSMAKLSTSTQKYTLHGHWLQTSTSTGRLSMEEPNLQSVEHAVEFKMDNNDVKGGESDGSQFKINARDFFIPTQDHWVLLTADYSQIELRLMAHFSQDTSLIELLSKPHGDVFNMLAARWTAKSESSVAPRERDQTKRLIYGILYGMGANTLAEQLECSRDDAAEKIQSFKNSFPGVASWLHDAVAFCRQNGYIMTLKGRKRFLSKIKLGNSKEKSKAQRQAVNSICQGSAADIIKIAMINLHSLINDDFFKCASGTTPTTQFEMLRGRCRILLQVHDELVLEVDPSVIKEAGLLLQMSMETAASLLVPLQVKMKVGKTWGSLEPFQAGQPLIQT